MKTSTSIPTGQEVNVTYGTGYFSGYECKCNLLRLSSLQLIIIQTWTR